MGILKNLDEKDQKNTDEIMRICENCGVQKPSSKSINFIGIIGSPGHFSLSSFQCIHVEHWACSPECWKIIAHACIDEHLHVLLLRKHKQLTNNGN